MSSFERQVPGADSVTTGATQRDAFLSGEGDAYARRNRGAQPPTPELIRGITGRLPDGGELLEVGCGSGRLLISLGEHLGPSWRLSGLDPSRLAVDHLRQREPSIDARVGSADAIPFDGSFDAVLLGFFLYVVDRRLLFRVASEVDRVLDAGTEEKPAHLFIVDFDPPEPVRNEYRHKPGMTSWKMDYSRIFLANPDYRIREHVQVASQGPDPADAVGLWTLERVAGSGYRPQQ